MSVFGPGIFRTRSSNANLSQVRKARSHRHALRILDVVTVYGPFLFIFSRHMLTLYCTLADWRPLPVHLHFSFFSRHVAGPKLQWMVSIYKNRARNWVVWGRRIYWQLTAVATVAFSTNICPSVFTAVICQCTVFWLWHPIGFSWCTKLRRKWSPPSFLFRTGTCEDKMKFCKYAADRRIHCGAGQYRTRKGYYSSHYNSLLIPALWQIIDCLLKFLYHLCHRGNSDSDHMSLHEEDSWIVNSKGFGRSLTCPRRYRVLAFALSTE